MPLSSLAICECHSSNRLSNSNFSSCPKCGWKVFFFPKPQHTLRLRILSLFCFVFSPDFMFLFYFYFFVYSITYLAQYFSRRFLSHCSICSCVYIISLINTHNCITVTLRKISHSLTHSLNKYPLSIHCGSYCEAQKDGSERDLS